MKASELKIGQFFAPVADEQMLMFRCELPIEIAPECKKGAISCIVLNEKGAFPAQIMGFEEIIIKENPSFEGMPVFTISKEDLEKMTEKDTDA